MPISEVTVKTTAKIATRSLCLLLSILAMPTARAEEPTPQDEPIQLTRFVAPSSVATVAPNLDQAPDALSGSRRERACTVVGRIDYLPMSFRLNGCHARALYMNMELTAAGIPSNAQYLFGILRPRGLPFVWLFHVAPLVHDETDGSLYVLDPCFSGEALSVDDWAERQRPIRPKRCCCPAGAYITVRQRMMGHPKVAALQENLIEPAQSLADVPAYHIEDILSAYRIMDQFIGFEQITVAEKKRKRLKLYQATHRLLHAVDRMGKLDSKLLSARAQVEAVAAELDGE